VDTREECRSVRGSLIAYVDGELSAVERRAADVHLPTCADCRREIEALRGMAALVQESFAEGPEAAERWRHALGRGKERVAALRRPRRSLPAVLERLVGHPVRALAATIVLSVALAETLDLLGLQQEGLQVLSYLLSLSLS
jgi:anti-sigma factor RsiW